MKDKNKILIKCHKLLYECIISEEFYLNKCDSNWLNLSIGGNLSHSFGTPNIVDLTHGSKMRFYVFISHLKQFENLY